MTAESYLVIGGEGFLGSNLVRSLLSRYPTSRVVSLDLSPSKITPAPSSPLYTFHSGDLTSLSSLTSAFSLFETTTVFHTASPWTGSGKDICEKVNVEGTRTIVQACRDMEGVRKLVFTSSAGTVYDGRDLINVDERMPFPEKALDHYNLTKAQAETIVLEANGKDGLLTVALRPAGIFGPGDRQALPGMMDVLKSKKTNFQVGANLNLFDWTYVDNVVHAHLLASERLTQTVSIDSLETRYDPVELDVKRRDLPTSGYRPSNLLAAEIVHDKNFKNTRTPDEKLLANRNRYDQFYPRPAGAAPKTSYKVAGEAFFITGGTPIYFWDFPRALWAAYNGHEPSWVLPMPAGVGLFAASCAEWVAWLSGKTPGLTRGKVVYSTVNRFYNIEKARRVLGYEPIVGLEEGIKRAVAWYKQQEALDEKVASQVVDGKTKKEQ